MKTKIIIILVVVILIALSVLAVKKHIDNSVVDKYGMIYSENNTENHDYLSSDKS